MKKKLVSLMVVLALAVTAIAGCGSSDSETAESTEAASPQIKIKSFFNAR